MRTLYKRVRGVVIVAASVSLLVTACSSSSKSTPSSAGSTAAGSSSAAGSSTAAGSTAAAAGTCKAAPSGSAVKIGVISADTGPAGLQGQGDAPAAVAAWKKYIVCQGGVAGHPVDVTYIDDKSNPTVSIQAANTLIKDHVVAILDNTVLDTTWAKAVDAAKIPVISMMAAIGGAIYATDPNFYANQNVGVPTGNWGIAKAAELSGKKKMGVLYCTEVAACAQLPKVVGGEAKKIGLNLVYSAAFSASQPNYTALCLAAKAKGVEVLSPIGTPQEMKKVYTDCAAQGYHPVATFVGQGLGADLASYGNAIPEIYGALGTVPWFVHNAATKPFFDAMDPYINSSGFKASGNTPSGLIADWVGLQMFAAAAANAGANPTSADIVKGLLSFKGNTIGGLASPLTFTKGHLRGNCEFLFAIKKGVPSLPNGLTPVCLTDMSIP